MADFPTDISEEAFCDYYSYHVYDTATLYVPTGSKLNYMMATGWSKFKNIVEFDPATTNPIEIVGVKGVTEDKTTSVSVYSLLGQKLTAPHKGINIINGKKVVVK